VQPSGSQRAEAEAEAVDQTVHKIRPCIEAKEVCIQNEISSLSSTHQIVERIARLGFGATEVYLGTRGSVNATWDRRHGAFLSGNFLNDVREYMAHSWQLSVSLERQGKLFTRVQEASIQETSHFPN